MEECKFAPQINRKKRAGGPASGSIQNSVPDEVLQDYGAEEYEQPRDIDTFVADQNRFLENKRLRAEQLKMQKEAEE